MKKEVKDGRYEDGNGIVRWHKDGQKHRVDGPAIEWPDGHREWWLNGQKHRVDGPAIEYSDGANEWWLNGQRHRLDGPAVENTNGYRAWYQNGELHRLDGPAVILDEYTEWYINNVEYTKEDHYLYAEKIKLNEKLQTTLEEKLLVKKVKI